MLRLLLIPLVLHLVALNKDALSANAALIGPLYITNAEFTSVLTLRNRSANIVTLALALKSLEAEDIGGSSISVPSHSELSVQVDEIETKPHLFSTLGSIHLSTSLGSLSTLVAYITIMPRSNNSGPSLREDLQPTGQLSSVLTGFVPASFSVPIIAVHSLSERSQQLLIECLVADGGSYESEISLPAGMTLLVNACVSRRSESRSYMQLLAGEGGLAMPATTVHIKSDVQGPRISAWGFATAVCDRKCNPQFTGIDFAQKQAAAK